MTKKRSVTMMKKNILTLFLSLCATPGLIDAKRAPQVYIDSGFERGKQRSLNLKVCC